MHKFRHGLISILDGVFECAAHFHTDLAPRCLTESINLRPVCHDRLHILQLASRAHYIDHCIEVLHSVCRAEIRPGSSDEVSPTFRSNEMKKEKFRI